MNAHFITDNMVKLLQRNYIVMLGVLLYASLMQAQNWSACLAGMPQDIGKVDESVKMYKQLFPSVSGREADSLFFMWYEWYEQCGQNYAARLNNDTGMAKVLAEGTVNSTYRDIQKSLQESGYKVITIDGFALIVPADSVWIIKQWQNSLSKPMRQYVALLCGDNMAIGERGHGGIKDIAERFTRWEIFCNENPTCYVTPQQKAVMRGNIELLLLGSLNQSAFPGKGNELHKEFRDAYAYIIEHYPKTQTAKVLKEYLHVLAKNNYLLTDDVKAYIQHHFPQINIPQE